MLKAKFDLVRFKALANIIRWEIIARDKYCCMGGFNKIGKLDLLMMVMGMVDIPVTVNLPN